MLVPFASQQTLVMVGQSWNCGIMSHLVCSAQSESFRCY